MMRLNSCEPTVYSAPRANDLVEVQSTIYREARAGGATRGLMTWLLDRRNLEGAFERVRGTDGAQTPGVDGVGCEEVRPQAVAWLSRLAEDIYHERYVPAAIRWVEIPKPHKPGQTRRLGILTVRDRVVHAALKQVLEPVLEPVFLSMSFGFRPGRSVPGALAEAVRRFAGSGGSAYSHGVHLDVADCFDTVDHRLLIAELARHVADGNLLRLVERLLRAGDPQAGRGWFRRDQGLVQGSSLSPLLCNLALHPLDEACAQLAQETEQGVALLRYADDLLILAREARHAERGVSCVRTVLGRLQQKLRRPVDAVRPIRQGVDWLGVRLQSRQLPWSEQVRFGYEVPGPRVVQMLQRLDEMTAPPSERIDAAAFNLARWITSINEQLRDWRQVYLFADNAGEVFRALDERAGERVGALLQAVLGLRRGELVRHRTRLARGFSTWQVPGAQLVVLSALAPHAAGNLIRRPVWMRERPVTAMPTLKALPAPVAVPAGPDESLTGGSVLPAGQGAVDPSAE